MSISVQYFHKNRVLNDFINLSIETAHRLLESVHHVIFTFRYYRLVSDITNIKYCDTRKQDRNTENVSVECYRIEF